MTRILFPIIALLIISGQAFTQERPHGTVPFKEYLYIDQTEITVESWLSFYTWVLINEGYEKASSFLPDSTAIEPLLWEYIKRGSEELLTNKAFHSEQPIGYFEKDCYECDVFGYRLRKHKFAAFCPMLTFPITGVSYNQVRSFCEWRTFVQGKGNYKFRLPTEKEWIEFTKNGMNEAEKLTGLMDSLNDKGCAPYNYNIKLDCKFSDIYGNIVAVALFSPNKKNAYDLFGNVSEMVLEQGLAKGGNFTSPASKSQLDSVQTFKKGEKWLGFRCIAEKQTGKIEIDKSLFSVTDTCFNETTKNKFCKFKDPRDGKTYLVVRINEQVWFAENLKHEILNAKFKIDNNKYHLGAKKQYSYNWETAKNVCPIGWHLPSKNEFEELMGYVGSSPKDVYKKLFLTGNSGFTALEGVLFYWLSSENNNKKAFGYSIGFLKPSVYIDSWPKRHQFAVRCIKD